MERHIDEEVKKLIEELCNKEVKRTGLPLRYIEARTKIIGNITYFHQEMKLDVEDFDIVVLENQNNLLFKNGKWELGHAYDKFYGYELVVKQNDYVFIIHLDECCIPTESKIIESLTSDRFKEVFNEYKRMKEQISKIKDDIRKLEDKEALYLESEK